MTRWLTLTAAFMLAISLAGCAAGTGSSPKADIAALEISLTAADTLALAYIGLPVCGTGAPPLCHQPAIVAKIGPATLKAYRAVKAAQVVINAYNPDSGAIANALSEAGAAIDALNLITSTLPTKTGV